MSEILSEDLQDIAVGAGEIVLENGGETYRAEDTVVHVAKALGATEASAFVTPTVVMLSYADENGKHHSYMRRIFKRGTNLSRLGQINKVSRQLVLRGKTSNPKMVKNLLHRIDNSPQYPSFLVILMAALSSAFFTLMFEGSLMDGLWSFLIGGFLRIVLVLISRTAFGQNSFIVALLSGAILSTLTDLVCLTPMAIDPNLVLVGAIMQCVPGLAMVNGIRDIISGDLVSGGARLLDAFMIGAGLSLGSVVGVLVNLI